VHQGVADEVRRGGAVGVGEAAHAGAQARVARGVADRRAGGAARVRGARPVVAVLALPGAAVVRDVADQRRAAARARVADDARAQAATAGGVADRRARGAAGRRAAVRGREAVVALALAEV